jgi:uncharacterized protein (DUF488 family)
VYTIGHSTRTLDDFVALLHAHGVTQLADVRSIPRSRRHPHFAGEALLEALPAAGVTYRHFRELGGMRKLRVDSSNTAWHHPGFRGYADYMETPAFASALEDLMLWVEPGDPERVALHTATAIMCAEAVWWRCHRQLISDALVARGVEVRHIVSTAAPKAHTLTNFARVTDRRVTYPGLI